MPRSVAGQLRTASARSSGSDQAVGVREHRHAARGSVPGRPLRGRSPGLGHVAGLPSASQRSKASGIDFAAPWRTRTARKWAGPPLLARGLGQHLVVVMGMPSSARRATMARLRVYPVWRNRASSAAKGPPSRSASRRGHARWSPKAAAHSHRARTRCQLRGPAPRLPRCPPGSPWSVRATAPTACPAASSTTARLVVPSEDDGVGVQVDHTETVPARAPRPSASHRCATLESAMRVSGQAAQRRCAPPWVGSGFGRVKEACGVFGVYAPGRVSRT